eukprot:4796796-Prymnesium_polylepis.1
MERGGVRRSRPPPAAQGAAAAESSGLAARHSYADQLVAMWPRRHPVGGPRRLELVQARRERAARPHPPVVVAGLVDLLERGLARAVQGGQQRLELGQRPLLARLEHRGDVAADHVRARQLGLGALQVVHGERGRRRRIAGGEHGDGEHGLVAMGVCRGERKLCAQQQAGSAGCLLPSSCFRDPTTKFLSHRRSTQPVRPEPHAHPTRHRCECPGRRR